MSKQQLFSSTLFDGGQSFKIILILGLLCIQSLSQVQQRSEKTDNIQKSIILNQRLVIDYDTNIYKFAFLLDSQRIQSETSGSCDQYQRSVKSLENYVEDIPFNTINLDIKDTFLAFQYVGQTFISISKQGKVSLFSINKNDKKLVFIESFDLKLSGMLDYQPIILIKDKKQAFIILKNLLVLVDVEAKQVTTNDQVNLDGMTKNAIYNFDTLYIPLKLQGMMKIKLSIGISNNIVIQKQEKITKVAATHNEAKVSISDIYYSSKLDKFFILDYNQGIFVTDDTFTNSIIQIAEISKGYSFSFYENSNKQITVVVLEETISTPRGIEVYIDTSVTPYKYEVDKPIRLLEAPWSKVIMFDHFCIFQGKSTHAITYHSTIQNQDNYYYNRIPDFLTKEQTNTILILSESFEPYTQNDNKFIAFSFFDKGYSVSSINVQSPQLVCHPKLEDQKGISTYLVTLFSNHCISEKTSNIWVQCKITHQVEIEVEKILVDDTNGAVIAGIVIGTIVGILIIIFLIYNGIRKYKARIQGLEREFVQLSSTTKAEKYQEMQQDD